MEADNRRALRAAIGFAELGLYDDALAELDSSGRPSPETEALRMEILRRARRWEEMRERAKERVESEPAIYEWWILWADATRHSLGLIPARALLERALAKFPGNGHILFQLACYSAQLGELDKAKEFLEGAVAADERWADISHVDRDLDPLWAARSES